MKKLMLVVVGVALVACDSPQVGGSLRDLGETPTEQCDALTLAQTKPGDRISGQGRTATYTYEGELGLAYTRQYEAETSKHSDLTDEALKKARAKAHDDTMDFLWKHFRKEMRRQWDAALEKDLPRRKDLYNTAMANCLSLKGATRESLRFKILHLEYELAGLLSEMKKDSVTNCHSDYQRSECEEFFSYRRLKDNAKAAALRARLKEVKAELAKEK